MFFDCVATVLFSLATIIMLVHTLVCPTRWSYFNGNCWFVSLEVASWAEADWQCSSRYGGALATIQSASDDRFIAHLVAKYEEDQVKEDNHLFNKFFFDTLGSRLEDCFRKEEHVILLNASVTVRGFDRVFIDIDREEAATNLDKCNKVFWELYERHKQHEPEIQMKEVVWQKLNMIISQSIPGATLLQKGSTVNNLSTLNSDLDLCLVVLNPENNTYDDNISFEILDKTERILKLSHAVRTVELIDARVTILKVEMNYPYNHFAIDITCNCLIGIFNSHLLSYYSRLDERFPALAVLVKDQAKKVLVIDPRNGRLNSYAIILMLIHYLQCVVNPPILPNLMKLFPKMFDGKGDPKKLRYDCKLDLPKIPKNTRTLVELAYGFYNYYAQFEYDICGISIYDATVFDRSLQNLYDQDYAFFLEEPYSKLTAAHNLKDRSLEELIGQFGLARDAILKDLLGFTPVELLDEQERKDREWFGEL